MTELSTNEKIDSCFNRLIRSTITTDVFAEVERALNEVPFYDVLKRYVVLPDHHVTRDAVDDRERVMGLLRQLVLGPLTQTESLSACVRVMDEHPEEAYRLARTLFAAVINWSGHVINSALPGLFTKEHYDMVFVRASTQRRTYLKWQLEKEKSLDDRARTLCLTLSTNWTGTYASMIETAATLARVTVHA
jgi:hypothetical protein